MRLPSKGHYQITANYDIQMAIPIIAAPSTGREAVVSQSVLQDF